MSEANLEIVHVGRPPENFEDCLNVKRKTVLVAFHNIASHAVRYTRQFTAFGHRWYAVVYRDGDGWTQVHFWRANSNTNSLEISVQVGHRSSNGNGISFPTMKKIAGQAPGCGWPEFAKWDNLKDNLVNGALVLEVSMWTRRQGTDREITGSEFVPSNPFLNNMLKEYANEETSDVSFEVGGVRECDDERWKQARTVPTTLHAHHLVLKCNAPALAEMCKPGTSSPVRLPNVSPEVFKHMLYYCYGGEISQEDLEENSRELVDAADRFGMANLKLKAEACLVRNATFTPDNILDSLLYADSKNCALLLEKAMDYVVENRNEVIKKVSFEDLPGSMLRDFLAALGSKGQSGKGESDFEYMRVCELRQRLHAKGLCVDGSKKAMVALLKENSA